MQLNFAPLLGKKNLLAFSAGVDSSALFYLLLDAKIEFDIAIVDYNIRKQSKQEVAYAKDLATKHAKKLYIKEVQKIDKNFEHRAREIRYRFFDELMNAHGYQNLITAHQLDDRFEWFMMQLSRGAGLSELCGIQSVTQKNGYCIVRPCLDVTKLTLQKYLDAKGYRYFVDATNNEEKYKRNYFRANFTQRFLREFSTGIAKSFSFLNRDKDILKSMILPIFEKKMCKIYVAPPQQKALVCANALKSFGYVMSANQRNEILRANSVVVGGDFAVGSYQNIVFITKYSNFVMNKKQKEQCRVAKIPKHCRPYLCEEGFDLEAIAKMLLQHTTTHS
jgi:tRNA(Ile)-lysidine synthase